MSFLFWPVYIYIYVAYAFVQSNIQVRIIDQGQSVSLDSWGKGLARGPSRDMVTLPVMKSELTILWHTGVEFYSSGLDTTLG